LPSSAVVRFTLIRSCAAYVRIIVTSALSTRLTRTWALFPAALVLRATDDLVLAGLVGEPVADP
jgi:hypothetical protein